MPSPHVYIESDKKVGYKSALADFSKTLQNIINRYNSEVEIKESCISEDCLNKALEVYDRHYDGDEKDAHGVALRAVLEAQPVSHSAVVWTGEINGVHVGLYGTVESIEALDSLMDTLEELDGIVTTLGI